MIIRIPVYTSNDFVEYIKSIHPLVNPPGTANHPVCSCIVNFESDSDVGTRSYTNFTVVGLRVYDNVDNTLRVPRCSRASTEVVALLQRTCRPSRRAHGDAEGYHLTSSRLHRYQQQTMRTGHRSLLVFPHPIARSHPLTTSMCTFQQKSGDYPPRSSHCSVTRAFLSQSGLRNPNVAPSLAERLRKAKLSRILRASTELHFLKSLRSRPLLFSSIRTPLRTPLLS